MRISSGAFLVLLSVVSSFAVGQEPPPSRLSSAIVLQNADATWDALLGDLLVVDSRTDQAGRFEIVTLSYADATRNDLVDFHRLRVGFDGPKYRNACWLDMTGLPMFVAGNGSIYTLTEDSTWAYCRRRWHVLVDHDQWDELFFEGSTEFAEDRIRLDLGKMLRAHFPERRAQFHWTRSCSTLTMVRPDGFQCHIRLHSPSDQLLVGTEIAEVKFISADGCHVRRIESISRRSADAGHFDWNALATNPQLKSKIVASREEGALVEVVRTREHLDTCQALWHTLLGTEPVDDEYAAKLNQLNGNLNLKQQAQGAMYFSTAVTLLADQEYSDADQRERVLDGGKMTWFIAQKVFEEWLVTQDLPCPVEDSTDTWKRFETVFTPKANLSYYYASLDYCYADFLSQKDRLFMAEKMASLGHPVHDGSGETVRRFIKDDPLAEAILYSGWKWPLAARHVDASHKVLRLYKATSVGARAVTNAMMNADLVDEIPEENMQAWFHYHVVIPKQEFSVERSLKDLTAIPSGQAWLIDRLRTGDDASAVKDRIRVALRKRLENTRRLQRYDFMSQERCCEIEQTLASLGTR